MDLRPTRGPHRGIETSVHQWTASLLLIAHRGIATLMLIVQRGAAASFGSQIHEIPQPPCTAYQQAAAARIDGKDRLGLMTFGSPVGGTARVCGFSMMKGR